MIQFNTYSHLPINNVTQSVPKRDLTKVQPAPSHGCPINNVTQKPARVEPTATGIDSLDSKAKWQYKTTLRKRYEKARKQERSIILDELIKNAVFKSRKAAIRSMNEKGKSKYRYHQRGRKKEYTDIETQYLVKFWRLTRRMNSKRLKAAMPKWFKSLPDWPDQIKQRLLKMAPSTIDIYLIETRKKEGLKLRSQTRPPKKHIKQIIKLRDPSEVIDKPGFGQSDTVVHCGSYAWGKFAGSVTFTDIESGWTEGQMILGKEAKSTVEALEDIESRLPIKLHTLYFDNGCEFINYEMVNTFKTRRKSPVELKRSREGRKNDQCYIEQKNNVFVRGLLGYERIDTQEVVDLVNNIYRDEWSKLFNYFYPQMKLIEKDRYGARVRKKYDKPKTPYHRLMLSKYVPKEIKKSLWREKQSLDPIALNQRLNHKINSVKKMLQKTDEKVKVS